MKIMTYLTIYDDAVTMTRTQVIWRFAMISLLIVHFVQAQIWLISNTRMWNLFKKQNYISEQ